MADAPVILLAFANDPSRPLSQLTKEDDAVNKALRPGFSKNYFKIIPDSFSTLNKLSASLRDFNDQVIIFHYGGHASSDTLILEDGSANATGIGGLLGSQNSLKLVFLNGCSTLEQVKILREKGIPAVIATSVPINDETASNFSSEFYQSLSKGMTLEEAFNHAASFVSAASNKVVSQFRGGFELDSPAAEFPWGLYYENDEILNWKLPSEPFNKIVIQSAVVSSGPVAPVNEILTSVLIESLAPYAKAIRRLKEDIEDEEEEVDLREVRQEIMDVMPAPVGEQIRKLFAADDKSGSAILDKVSEARLNQLLLTYTTLTELTAFIQLSQLWNELSKQPQLKFPDESKPSLKGFLDLSPATFKTFDYVALIIAVRKIFDENNIPYFVEELELTKEAMASDSDFKEAYSFMEDLKAKIGKSDPEIMRDIKDFCLKAEKHLANFFKHLGFIVKYNLISIKNIDLVTKRFEKPKFQHYQVHLDKVSAGYLDKTKTFTTHSDNKSVILSKTKKDISENLNLSPFVIDQNAYTGFKKAKLFFFLFSQNQGDLLHYKFSYIPKDMLRIDQSSDLSPVLEQYKDFYLKIFAKI